jgi:hypothetical protein
MSRRALAARQLQTRSYCNNKKCTFNRGIVSRDVKRIGSQGCESDPDVERIGSQSCESDPDVERIGSNRIQMPTWGVDIILYMNWRYDPIWRWYAISRGYMNGRYAPIWQYRYAIGRESARYSGYTHYKYVASYKIGFRLLMYLTQKCVKHFI